MSELPRPSPIAQIGWVVIDCSDPEGLAAFWGAVLGLDVGFRLGEAPQYVQLTEAGTGAIVLVFQRVPEPKTVKNRLHLDLVVDDVEAASSRIGVLGGTGALQEDFDEYGYQWRRVADPEGNEFCLVFKRPAD